MLTYFLGTPPSIFGYAVSVLLIAFGLVKLGHRLLDLLRDYRSYRDGR
jgi:hypothetical protein